MGKKEKKQVEEPVVAEAAKVCERAMVACTLIAIW